MSGSFFAGASDVFVDHSTFNVVNSQVQHTLPIDPIQKLREVAEWISPLSFRDIQVDTFKKRTHGTGEWFLTSQEFLEWVSKEQGVMWLTGMPGVGKTILASAIIDNLQRLSPDSKTAVIFAYCRYTDVYSAVDIMASLARQLVELCPSLSPTIKTTYDKHRKEKSRLSDNELDTLFLSLLQSFSKVFVVLDALDEASDECRTDLIERLAPFRVCLLMTSRPLDLAPILPSGVITIDIDGRTEGDIELFITRKINNGSRLRRLLLGDQDFCDSIVSKIKEKSNGMFLAAELHLMVLSKCNNKHALRVATDTLPTDLHNVYKITLSRIYSQGEDDAYLAIRALIWITYAFRPLTIEELQHALAVSPDDERFDEDKTTPVELIVTLSCGLIAFDPESDVVRLAHYTVDDFVHNLKSDLFSKPQSFITEHCIAYVLGFDFNMNDIKTRDHANQFRSQGALITYAYENWGHHARACYAEGGTPPCISAFILQVTQYPLIKLFDIKILAPCHTAAHYGLLDVLKLLQDTHSPRTSRGWTSLMLAAQQGHTAVVEFLLTTAKRCDVTVADDDGTTALHLAASGGHREIIRLLLNPKPNEDEVVTEEFTDHRIPFGEGNGRISEEFQSSSWVNVNAFTVESHSTALHLASQHGHKGAIEELLSDSSIDVNAKDDNGHTALHFVLDSRRDNKEIVCLFLANTDLNVNSTTKNGETPLHLALQYGNRGAIDSLLADSRIDINATSNTGRTALHFAASGLKEGKDIIHWLLTDKGFDVNATTNYGQTALHLACKSANRGVMEELLADSHIDLHATDNEGWNALHFAAHTHSWDGQSDARDVVRRLLAENVDINSTTNDGLTALHLACKPVNKGVVDELLADSRIDLHATDNKGWIALHFAADSIGDTRDVVHRFLADKGVDVNSTTNDGLTALHLARKSSNEGVIEELLADSHIDLHATDNKGWSALHFAADSIGDTRDAVHRFLAEKGVDINSTTNDGLTALHLACKLGNKGVVEELLADSRIDRNARDNKGRTALHFAADSFRFRDARHIVRWLLAEKGVDINSTTNDGLTALHLACKLGNKGVVEELLADSRVDCNARDNEGWTALHFTAKTHPWGEKLYTRDIVHRLLAEKGVDINSTTNDGLTALYLACKLGNKVVAEELLADSRIDRNARDNKGRTALHFAADSFRFRHTRHIVRWLLTGKVD